ncbi:MAG: tryptophan-rich sensory protein [Bacillota bacterium]
MEKKINKTTLVIKILALVAFLAMVIVNILGNTLPINNVTTGEIAEMYPDLFSPANYTFAIWSVIYILLALYLVYQSGLIKSVKLKETLIMKINIYFIISSIANLFWIFAWHYDMMWLSLALMLIIFISLLIIALEIKKHEMGLYDYIFINIPFFVYFAWATIATIANITTLLVSLGWNGWGIPDNIWMIIVTVIGLAIGLFTIIRLRDIAYGIVFIWGYTGILVRHLTVLEGEFTEVIITLAISLVLLFAATVYNAIRLLKKES